MSSPGRDLSHVLLISPATFKVEQNSSFPRVPTRVFFPSPRCMNTSTVRQPPVAPSYLPVCTGAPDCFHCLCWRKLSFPRMLSASRGGVIFLVPEVLSHSVKSTIRICFFGSHILFRKSTNTVVTYKV